MMAIENMKEMYKTRARLQVSQLYPLFYIYLLCLWASLAPLKLKLIWENKYVVCSAFNFCGVNYFQILQMVLSLICKNKFQQKKKQQN